MDSYEFFGYNIIQGKWLVVDVVSIFMGSTSDSEIRIEYEDLEEVSED